MRSENWRQRNAEERRDKLSYFRNENRSEEIGWSAYSVGQIGGELLKVADVEGYEGAMKIVDEA